VAAAAAATVNHVKPAACGGGGLSSGRLFSEGVRRSLWGGVVGSSLWGGVVGSSFWGGVVVSSLWGGVVGSSREVAEVERSGRAQKIPASTMETSMRTEGVTRRLIKCRVDAVLSGLRGTPVMSGEAQGRGRDGRGRGEEERVGAAEAEVRAVIGGG